MLWRVWKAVETKAGKIRIGKTKEERTEEEGEKMEMNEWKRKENKNLKRRRTMKVKKIAEEWKIWNKEKEIAKLEEKVKRLVPEQFYKWIHIVGKKASKRMFIRKL